MKCITKSYHDAIRYIISGIIIYQQGQFSNSSVCLSAHQFFFLFQKYSLNLTCLHPAYCVNPSKPVSVDLHQIQASRQTPWTHNYHLKERPSHVIYIVWRSLEMNSDTLKIEMLAEHAMEELASFQYWRSMHYGIIILN